MAYIYEVFEHLHRLWMRIWLHIHIVTSTDPSPDLWKLAEIQPDASVQTMPLQGLRTFQTASHVHGIHIWGVRAPSQVVNGHMASHSHRYHHRRFPRFVRVGWNPIWYKCTNLATTFWLWLQNLSNCIPFPCHTYMRGLSTISGCGWAYGLHSHHYHHKCFLGFVRVGWNPTWCKCANHATTLWLRL
jgi:hypothetical protein